MRGRREYDHAPKPVSVEGLMDDIDVFLCKELSEQKIPCVDPIRAQTIFQVSPDFFGRHLSPEGMARWIRSASVCVNGLVLKSPLGFLMGTDIHTIPEQARTTDNVEAIDIVCRRHIRNAVDLPVDYVPQAVYAALTSLVAAWEDQHHENLVRFAELAVDEGILVDNPRAWPADEFVWTPNR